MKEMRLKIYHEVEKWREEYNYERLVGMVAVQVESARGAVQVALRGAKPHWRETALDGFSGHACPVFLPTTVGGLEVLSTPRLATDHE
jgi:hypothetical protein